MRKLWSKLQSRADGRQILTVLSYLYAVGLSAKNWWRQKYPITRAAPAAVISIGNLTVGGSGKTTMTLYLAKRLYVDGRHVCVLTRGYRGGDEARMMKEQAVLGGFDLDIAIGPHRYERAMSYWRLADLSKKKRLVFLMDDAHQHETLKKDFSVVLIDSMDFSGYQALLPLGLLREPVDAGLRRADVVILTHVDLVSGERLNEWRAMLKKWTPDKPVFEAVQHPSGCRDILNGALERDVPQERPVYLVSGIGNPESFEETVQRHWRWRVTGHWKFEDHAPYSEEIIKRISQEAKRLGASWVVTTAKDAVKIVPLVKRLNDQRYHLLPWAEVEIAWMFQGSGQEERFWSLVDRAITLKSL